MLATGAHLTQWRGADSLGGLRDKCDAQMENQNYFGQRGRREVLRERRSLEEEVFSEEEKEVLRERRALEEEVFSEEEEETP